MSQNITQPSISKDRNEMNLYFHKSKAHTVAGHLQGLTFRYTPLG